MTTPHPEPAYNTKARPDLTYHIAAHTFHLAQSDTSSETGSTLWLSAQVLAEYLVATTNSSATSSSTSASSSGPRRVLELGSGIGLTALVLSTLGYDVSATDTAAVCEGFLLPNIARNAATLGAASGRLDVCELDWFKWREEKLLDDDFDLVVASDVVYEASHVPALCETIGRVARRGVEVVVVQEVRDPELWKAFVETLGGLGITGVKVSHAKVRKVMRGCGWEDDAWEGVVVWKFRRKTGG